MLVLLMKGKPTVQILNLLPNEFASHPPRQLSTGRHALSGNLLVKEFARSRRAA